MPQLEVPFYANPDGTHCFQACLRMVLKYFCLSDHYTWGELDELSGKRPGKWTWPLYAIGRLHLLGFEAAIVEDFDYLQFIAEPNKYILHRFGVQAGTEQIENSDIPYEVGIARKFCKLAGKPKIPTLADLREFLHSGFLPICCLNLPALYGESGYLGHFVVPVKIDDEFVIFRDPGIQTQIFPSRPASRVSRQIFENAWSNDRFVVGLKAAKQPSKLKHF